MKRKTKRRASRRLNREGDPFRSKARDSMQEWLEERLGRLPALEVRRMFGGAGIYVEGTMFGILHAGRVYLKTNESTRAEYTERGMKPFRPPRGAVLKNYYEVPPDTLDDEAELLTWTRRALAIAEVTQPQSKARAVSPEEILEGYPLEIRELAHHVRLGFEHGNRLSDPDRLLEPMGKQVRFVRLVPGKTIPLRGIQELIRTAIRTLPERRKA